jgi:hypothetical protein
VASIRRRRTPALGVLARRRQDVGAPLRRLVSSRPSWELGRPQLETRCCLDRSARRCNRNSPREMLDGSSHNPNIHGEQNDFKKVDYQRFESLPRRSTLICPAGEASAHEECQRTGYGDRLRMHCLLAYVNCRPTKTGVSFTWEGSVGVRPGVRIRPRGAWERWPAQGLHHDQGRRRKQVRRRAVR